MNQPHLRFEITSDDGFSVKADSIEGMTAGCPLCSCCGHQCGTPLSQKLGACDTHAHGDHTWRPFNLPTMSRHSQLGWDYIETKDV